MAIIINGKKIAGTGKPGKSAYETAIESGYAGVELDFYKDLGTLDEINQSLTDDRGDVIDVQANYYDKTQIDEKLAEIDVSDEFNAHNSDANAHEAIRNSITTGDANTLTSANKYTDTQISKIPTPDVSGQIGEHNSDETAHPHLLDLINNIEVPVTSVNGKTGDVVLNAADVGAAPAGFGGFGENLPIVEVASKDETYETFCGKVDTFLQNMSNSSAMLIRAYPPETYGMSRSLAVLYRYANDSAELRCVAWDDNGSYGWRMVKGSTWKPFEWVNPPFKGLTEYRTTETINQLAVYKRKTGQNTIEYRLDGETEWKPYANAVGALAMNGSNAMINDLKVSKEVASVEALFGAITNYAFMRSVSKADGKQSELLLHYDIESGKWLLTVRDQNNKTHNVYHTGWKPTAADVGAVALDGSNAMTGNLIINKTTPIVNLKDSATNASGLIFNANNRLYLQAQNSSSSDQNRRQIQLADSNAQVLNKALHLVDIVNGTATGYALYGEHNKPTAADVGASKAITGITRSGTTFTATHIDGTTSTFTQQDNNTTYSAATQSAAGLMSAADKKKLDGVATSANAYSHPTTSGNKHIPSGGSSGQILRWSADGTAAWGADNNTTYGVVSTSADGLAPKRDGSTTKYLRADGTWAVPPNTDTNTHYTTRIYAGASGTAANDAATSPYIKITDDNTYRNQIRLVGGGATTVTSDANGNITISSTDTNTNTDTKNTAGSTNTTSKIFLIGATSQAANPQTYSNSAVYATNGALVASTVSGAVWNDYAEYREADTIEAGRVVCENGDDTLSLSTERLQAGANIVSDTFGFSIGETDAAKTPIAVSGRVLAYPYEDRDTYKPGDAVCAAPNGTVSKMTREEIREYPERIIGTVSSVPAYETWGTGDVKVNGRIWIKVH